MYVWVGMRLEVVNRGTEREVLSESAFVRRRSRALVSYPFEVP